MLRWGLFGGAWPNAPWEVFVTLGGALVGSSVMFVLLFPLWKSYPWVGVTETSVFLGAAGMLLAIGIRRRRHDPQRVPGRLQKLS